jgi:WD40 repeat protein
MVHSLSGQSQPSTALNVSDDGKLVVSVSADTSCSIWEVSSGRLVRTLENAGECLSDFTNSRTPYSVLDNRCTTRPKSFKT